MESSSSLIKSLKPLDRAAASTTQQSSSPRHPRRQQTAGENPAELTANHEMAEPLENEFSECEDFDVPIKDHSEKELLSPVKPASQKSFRSLSSPGSVSGSSDGDDDLDIAKARSSLGLSSPSTFRRKSKSSEIVTKERSMRRLNAGSRSSGTAASQQNHNEGNPPSSSPPISPATSTAGSHAARQKRRSKSFVMEHGGTTNNDDAQSVSSMRRRRTRSVTRERSTSPGHQHRRHRPRSRDGGTIGSSNHSSTASRRRQHRSSSRDLASSTTSPARRPRPSVAQRISDSQSVGAPPPRRQRSFVKSMSHRTSSRSIEVDRVPATIGGGNTGSSVASHHSRKSSGNGGGGGSGSQRSSRTLNANLRATERNRVRSKAAQKDSDTPLSPESTGGRRQLRRQRSLSTDAAESRRRGRSRSQDASTTRSRRAPEKSKSVSSSSTGTPSSSNVLMMQQQQQQQQQHHQSQRSPGPPASRRTRLARRSASGTHLPTATTTTATTTSSVHLHRGVPSAPLTSRHHQHAQSASRSHHSSMVEPPPPPPPPEYDVDQEDYMDPDMTVDEEDNNEDDISMADTIQSGFIDPKPPPPSASGMDSIVSTMECGEDTKRSERSMSQRITTDPGLSPRSRPKLRGRRPRPEGSGEARKSASLPLPPTGKVTSSSPTKTLSSPRKQKSPSVKSSPSPSGSTNSKHNYSPSTERPPSLQELFSKDFGDSPVAEDFRSNFRSDDEPPDEPTRVDKPPSLEELFAVTLDERDEDGYEDSTTAPPEEEEDKKPQSTLDDLFASQKPSSFFGRASASLSDLFNSVPNFAAGSLPDPSVCSSPAASAVADRIFVPSKTGFSPTGNVAAAGANSNKLGSHFLRMNRSGSNFASLLADSSAGSSGPGSSAQGGGDNNSDVASLGSRDLSSGGTPRPLRRGLKKSRSFGDVAMLGVGNDFFNSIMANNPPTAGPGPRRGKKPTSIRVTKSEANPDPMGKLPEATHIVGMAAAVAEATTNATEGSVRVIRTTHTGRTVTASPFDDDVLHQGKDDDDASSATSSSDQDDTQQQEKEYLQLCLPSSTNTMTSATTSMTDMTASPLGDRQSPVFDSDGMPATTKGGIFQRFHRGPTTSSGTTPTTTAANRKTLLPPFRGPRMLRKDEKLVSHEDSDGGR